MKWTSPKDGYKIVLTADRTIISNYGGINFGGFFACLPRRLVPDFFLYRILCPKIPSDNGRALYGSYAIRKLEAALLSNGFSEKEVVVAAPDELEKVVGSETRIVGITTVDPMGYAPVSWTLCSLFGGGRSCTSTEFERLLMDPTLEKHRSHLQVVVGGPGVWQISEEKAKELGISTIFVGEGDESAPELFKRAVEGEKLPPIVYGKQSSIEKIPTIINPVRGGYVQITRGCGRGCQFCTPTMRRWVSFPKDLILKEVEVNIRGGMTDISFITDDGLRYGGKGLEINREAVIDLFKSTFAVNGVKGVGIAHASFPTVIQAPDLVHQLSEICGFDEENPFMGPQIGLETGSIRLIRKYMIGKPKPYKPEDWPQIVREASQILNDNYWYPCTTLIMGLPSETEDDVLKTIELVDDLKGTKQWLFPLFFVAMGGSILEREKSFTLDKMTRAHWDLLFECWEHSLKFAKTALDFLFKSGNPITRMVTKAFVKKGISLAEQYFNEVKKDPTIMMTSLKNVSSDSVLDLIKHLL